MLKTVEMIVDFRRNPPALPPLTIMNSTVTALESFRFLDFLRQLRKFNLPQELLKQFYSAIIESVFCTSTTLVQLTNQIWLQKTTDVSPNCWANHWYTPPQSPRTVLIQSEQKGWQKSIWTPHIQHTPSLNFYRLVDATELWVAERRDTGTVSSLKQSISWTLDNNYGTHTIYTCIHLFI